MIFEQPETDLAFRQQAHQFQQLFRGNGSGAFLFHFRFAGSAQAELEVRGRQRDAIALGLAEQVRKDGNRRLSLDYALRQIQLLQQVKLLYREFHLRFPPPGPTDSNRLLYPVLQ